jgi:uncharacterized protein YjeT (DUF2065 family)
LNWQDLLTALALLLVLEGIFPFLNPRGLRRTLLQAIELPDKVLRGIGLGSMVIGVLLLYLIR